MLFRLDAILEQIASEAASAWELDAICSRLTALGLAVDGTQSCGETHLLDLDIPANRGDVLSHRGIGRELAAGFAADLGDIDVTVETVPGAAADHVGITIEEPDLCRRYVGRVVLDVAPGSSPVALESRLESLGLRPVDNVVDATNWVLWELGHPLHAFDLDRLAGPQIVVRRARGGETIVTLDGEERKLDPQDLVIADAERPVAIAGVMGGRDTEITEATSRILLESAWFEPISVRATARRHGLRTDASVRFERGADPEMAPVAAERFCKVLEGLGGGTFLAEALDVHPVPHEPETVSMRWDRADSLMGLALRREDLVGVLERLGFELQEGDAGTASITVSVPSWRPDVEREIDLVEEVARHQGFDGVPSILPPWSGTASSPMQREVARRESLRDAVAAAGCLETVHYPFIAEEVDAAWRYREGESRTLPLRNPLVRRQAVMRGSLLPGLLTAARSNVGRGREDLRLFEMGKRFWTEAEVPAEAWTLAWLLAGRAPGTLGWREEDRPVDFWDVKGLLEQILSARRLSHRVVAREWAFLHPSESGAIEVGGEVVGALGRLHPDRAAALDFEAPVYVAEIDIETLVRQQEEDFEVASPSRYPWAERDLSLLVPQDVSYSEVVAAIRSVGQEALVDVWPLDRYQGEGIPEDHVSLTLRLRYQRADRTMEPDEATELSEAVVECLSRELRARLRS